MLHIKVNGIDSEELLKGIKQVIEMVKMQYIYGNELRINEGVYYRIICHSIHGWIPGRSN